MADALDLLHAEWRKQPDQARTLALCATMVAMARPGMESIARDVGAHASAAFAQDPAVQLALGKMYISATMLSEAQQTLVNAGKLSPRDPEVYSWLGQALIRRGDAERAEKVFERAIALGATGAMGADAQMWLERARVFKPVQAARGQAAVEKEVARSLGAGGVAIQEAAPAPVQKAKVNLSVPTISEERTIDTSAANMAKLEASIASRPEPAAPKPRPSLRPIQNRPSSQPRQSVPAGSLPPIPALAAIPALAPSAPSVSTASFGMPANDAMTDDDEPTAHGLPPAGDDDDIDMALGSLESAAPPVVAAPAPTPFAQPAPPFEAPPFAAAPFAPPPFAAFPFAPPPPLNQADTADPIEPRALQIPQPAPSTHALRRLPQIAMGAQQTAPAAPPGPRPDFTNDAGFAPSSDKPRAPHARDVLDALAAAGIFEREVAALGAGAWIKPERTATSRKKPLIFLGMASGLTVLGLFASLYIVRMQRQKAFVEAGVILTSVETDLANAKVATLADDEKQIGTAFEKDSRSPRAALDWMRERVVAGLVRGGDEISFEDAIGRANEVGVSKDHVAFARVASAVFSGDTSSAISLLPELDALARTDAYFELMAGAALDRAGDARAQERFVAAQTLDSTMFLADLLLTRAGVLGVSSDRTQVQKQVLAFRAKYKDRAESAAIVALSWARDPGQRNNPEPPELAETLTRAAELPLPLAAVPPALLALRALAQHDAATAHTQLLESLGKADGPAMAAWLGEIALDLDDAKLAQRAALIAVSFSAVYPPARMLAARVELAGDRLDAAAQAVDQLEPSFPAVAVVRAAVSYERLDADGIARAFAALSPDAQASVELVGLHDAMNALTGTLALDREPLVALASDPSTWSDRIAFDAALDRGDLDGAQAVAATLRADDTAPLTQLRRARLARYLGHLDDADTLGAAALAGAPGPRTIAERVFLLVAKNQDADAAALLARAAASPLTTWLSAYVSASSGHLDEARARTASIDPPPDLAPLLVRTAAVLALAAAKDAKRGKVLAASLLAAGDANPDVTAAATSLGLTVKTPATAKTAQKK